VLLRSWRQMTDYGGYTGYYLENDIKIMVGVGVDGRMKHGMEDAPCLLLATRGRALK